MVVDLALQSIGVGLAVAFFYAAAFRQDYVLAVPLALGISATGALRFAVVRYMRARNRQP
ncbi:MAG: hypothetical protein HY874_11275 [Chloroflexi bacterium]|nr:hypothetical protein [Chloroflexota bacterium]